MKNITRLFVAASMLFVSTYSLSLNVMPQCPPSDPACVPVESQTQPQVMPQCPPSDPSCVPAQ